MFMKVGVSNPDEIAEHGPPEPAPPYSGVRYRAMGLRDRLRRLERDAGDLSGTLKMPDGTEVSYQRSEMFDALLAAIDGREHRLLPYLREAEPDTNKRMPGLIRALGGNEARGAQG